MACGLGIHVCAAAVLCCAVLCHAVSGTPVVIITQASLREDARAPLEKGVDRAIYSIGASALTMSAKENA